MNSGWGGGGGGGGGGEHKHDIQRGMYNTTNSTVEGRLTVSIIVITVKQQFFSARVMFI